MKAVLMSIQPKWCELIANGKKTVEVRKTKPKLETPFKVYIYCTKGQHETLWRYFGEYYYDTQFPNERPNRASGKVIGEFVCDKVEQGHILWVKEQPEYYEKTDEKTQLTYRQMLDYLGEKGIGCFWHISDLVIYDKPKDLWEFHKPCTDIKNCLNKAFREAGRCLDKCFDCGNELTRPPQSWCYVEELG